MQNSFENLQKNNQKSIPNQPLSRPRFRRRFCIVLHRFWLHLGAILGARLGSSWGHVGQKLDFWRSLMTFKNGYDFQPHSGPFWDRFWNDFWDPKCTQHPSNFDLKTDREANAEIFKNISRGYVFDAARNRKPVKNQHTFVFKIVLSANTK